MKIYYILFFTLLLAGCAEQAVDKELPQGLMKFSNTQEISDYIKDNSIQQPINMRGDVMMATAEAGAPDDAQKSSEFSQTNIQVQGVDEADFVKNDGKYIYLISGGELVIVDAYPDAKIISSTDMDGNPMNLFVNGDRLVVFSSVDDEVYHISQYDFVPRPTYSQSTHAYVFDISNRKNPKLLHDFSVDGYYFESRMIGDDVYLITKENIYSYVGLDMPMVREGGMRLISPDVYYFPNPDNQFVFHTIASFNIINGDIDADTYLLGYSDTVYFSNYNLYVAYQKNQGYADYSEDRFYDAVVPLLPIKGEVQKIRDSDGTAIEKWSKVSSLLEDMYNSMDKEDKEILQGKIENAVQEYDAKIELERSKTVIHRFSLDGTVEYQTKGEVSGRLLNQFSLDEYEENLRVATTTNIWSRNKNVQYNNVFVLDEDLDIIGSLEEIAPDESIYSARFIGDRLYLVTFERIDPFFVIDLSDPTSPDVLGALKIPGYSDYLHPYDEDHIIGVGKGAKENQWGGITTTGVKIALFDVSDVEDPKEVDVYSIGGSGSHSEALDDHKAFLFDRKKNLLVLPVTEVNREEILDNGRFEGYRETDSWQGAYVLGLTPEDGFTLKGKISHGSGADNWYYPFAIRRSLYMDDILYTLSAKRIMMHDIETVDEVGAVELPYKNDGIQMLFD